MAAVRRKRSPPKRPGKTKAKRRLKARPKSKAHRPPRSRPRPRPKPRPKRRPSPMRRRRTSTVKPRAGPRRAIVGKRPVVHRPAPARPLPRPVHPVRPVRRPPQALAADLGGLGPPPDVVLPATGPPVPMRRPVAARPILPARPVRVAPARYVPPGVKWIEQHSAGQYTLNVIEVGGQGDCMFHVVARALNQRAANADLPQIYSVQSLRNDVADYIGRLGNQDAETNGDVVDLDGFIKRLVDLYAPGGRYVGPGTLPWLHVINRAMTNGSIPSWPEAFRAAGFLNWLYGFAGPVQERWLEQVQQNVESGAVSPQQARQTVMAGFRQRGNYHWGSNFDLAVLSDLHDIGYIAVRSTGGYICNATRPRRDYCIIYYASDVHFQIAELVPKEGPRAGRGRMIWDCNALPDFIKNSYAAFCSDRAGRPLQQIACAD